MRFFFPLFLILTCCLPVFTQEDFSSLLKSEYSSVDYNARDILARTAKWKRGPTYLIEADSVYSRPDSINEHIIFSQRRVTIPCIDRLGSDCSYSGRVKYRGRQFEVTFSRKERLSGNIIHLTDSVVVLETRYHPISIKTSSKTKKGKILAHGRSIEDKTEERVLRYILIKED